MSLSRRLLALTSCTLAAPLLFGTATAAAQSFDDPAGDVLPCTGECSTFDQDLSGVTVESSGGQVSFTIEQFGPFTGPTTCRCFFPQVHIYRDAALPAKPDYYTAEWTGDPPALGIIRPIALFDRSLTQTGTGVNNCPTPGGFNGVGKLADIPSVTPSATSVTYTFNLAAIGSPGSFDWRIVEPAASTCQTQGNPEPNPRDVLPDVGLATFSAAGAGADSCADAKAKLKQAKKKVKKTKKKVKKAKQSGTDAQVAKAKKKLKKAKKKLKKAKMAVEEACG
jgi:hypothetical protein